jgi:hypothetical protein
MPLARMAATLVTNSRKEPRAWCGAGLQRQPGHGQRRHQRDRDGHAGQRVGDIGSGQGNRTYRPGSQGGYQVRDARGDPGGDLAVGGRDHRVGDEQAHQPPDHHHGGRAGQHQHDAPAQVGPVGQHDGQHDPQDRGHQRGHDHGPDHGGCRVADHPGRGDHRCQRQQQPVAAQPAAAFGALEEQLVAHSLDVGFSQSAHLRVPPAGSATRTRTTRPRLPSWPAADRPDLHESDCPGQRRFPPARNARRAGRDQLPGRGS